MSEKNHRDYSDSAAAPQADTPEDVISSETILKGNQEVLIQHGETIYRLRITQNGKLILCK